MSSDSSPNVSCVDEISKHKLLRRSLAFSIINDFDFDFDEDFEDDEDDEDGEDGDEATEEDDHFPSISAEKAVSTKRSVKKKVEILTDDGGTGVSIESTGETNGTKGFDEKPDAQKDNKDIEEKEISPSSYRNDDFFAESPYFDAFVNMEMQTRAGVTEILNDISKKTEDFAHSGLRMVKTARRLALSCKLDPRNEFSLDELKSKRKALEPEVVDGLERLGDVLDEMASAQELLFEILISNVVSSITSIAVVNDCQIGRMRDEAENETEEAEQLYMKYLRGGKDSWGGGLEGNSQHGRTGSRDYGVKSQSVIDAIHQTTRRNELVKTRTMQISAELKRYRLATRIIETKYQQNVDISRCTNKMVGAMDLCFSNCSTLTRRLVHRATNTKAKCEEFQLNHENRRWGKCENVFTNNLILARQAEIDAQVQVRKGALHLKFNTRNRKEKINLFDITEEYAQLWDLPATLASYGGNRRTAKGVLAEGWLYRSTGSSLMNTTSWNRGWYLIRKEGVFVLQARTEDGWDMRRSGHRSNLSKFTIEKVKVCELRLCTIREIQEEKDDPSTRFCFELITPSNFYKERILLQARGPYEFKMWLQAIRLGISCELAAGETKAKGNGSDHIEKPTSLLECFTFPRRSIATHITETPVTMTSEIQVTVLNRGRSMFASEIFSDDVSSLPDLLPPEVKKLMKANPTCADCGEEFPDWVSLNLGVLICLECSGVHRSLGVHISKVRSLVLDALNNRESSLLLSLGNSCVNQFWEREAQDDFEERKANRDKWIRRKYIKKEFIGVDIGSEGAQEDECNNLYEASKIADVVGVAKALIYGGKVNWENPNDKNKTAIEVCGLGLENPKDGKTTECKELLLQSGARKIFSSSHSSQYPHYEESTEFPANLSEDDEEDPFHGSFFIE